MSNTNVSRRAFLGAALGSVVAAEVAGLGAHPESAVAAPSTPPAAAAATATPARAHRTLVGVL
ncbi:hypothetical protein [Marisediminicola antarctica]|uniref:Uncharacterized protein n=1 Tax=Marisediminicola antarctica TaxID=674079 RepID=A0A7L5AFH5_9MICO|nr:hypothetical protein [Marisediminicola antarctica]QHO68676.1 hypothetical protein BHD05_02510 [Marisediminicola antarctica]